MTPTPNGQPIMGGGARQKRQGFGKYRTNQPPGNEPGGANGMYGRFGQTPDQQPSQAFDGSVDSMRRGFGGQQRQKRYGSQQQSAQTSPFGGGSAPISQPQQPTQREPDDAYMAAKRAQEAAHPGSTMSDEPTQAGWQATQQEMARRQQPMSSDFQNQERPFGRYAAQPQQAQSNAAGLGTQQSAMSGMLTQMSSQQQNPIQPQQQQAPQGGQTQQQQPQSFASPFGNMRFGNPSAMQDGQMVTKPTLALIGEDGPEAVVPLDGHAGSKLTPSMMQPRDTFQTGTSSLGKPMHSLPPTDGPMSRFKRYGM
jgi:hypothetical protein